MRRMIVTLLLACLVGWSLAGCAGDSATPLPATASSVAASPSASATAPNTGNTASAIPTAETTARILDKPTKPVSHKQGVTVTVDIQNLKAGHGVMMLDQTNTYYLDDAKIATNNGQVSFTSVPLGDGSDTSVAVVIIEGPVDVLKGIVAQKPNADGDITVPALPAGCTEMDRADVPVV